MMICHNAPAGVTVWSWLEANPVYPAANFGLFNELNAYKFTNGANANPLCTAYAPRISANFSNYCIPPTLPADDAIHFVIMPAKSRGFSYAYFNLQLSIGTALHFLRYTNLNDSR